jgi:hypothetical protein
MKFGFGRFFRRASNKFWNALLWKGTQVWEDKVFMIRELEGKRTTGNALRRVCIAHLLTLLGVG